MGSNFQKRSRSYDVQRARRKRFAAKDAIYAALGVCRDWLNSLCVFLCLPSVYRVMTRVCVRHCPAPVPPWCQRAAGSNNSAPDCDRRKSEADRRVVRANGTALVRTIKAMANPRPAWSTLSSRALGLYTGALPFDVRRCSILFQF